MELQKRDVQILKFIYACRVASFQQILQRFFQERSRSVGYRRIDKLCDEGLLKPMIDLEYKSSVRFLSLEERAWEKIKSEWPYEIDTPYFKSESPRHDLHLNEIFFQLEKLKNYNAFLTENILQSSSVVKSDLKYRDLSRLYADAALVISNSVGNQFVFGVELELSKKAPERYNEKLSSYYKADGIDGVLYIAGNSEIQNAVVRADRLVCNGKETMLFSDLESSVLKDPNCLISKINFLRD